MLVGRETRALLGKELRQFRRSKGAMASATLLPFMLLVVVPLSQLFTLRAEPSLARGPLRDAPVVPPGLANLDAPIDLFTGLLMPLFVTLGGMVVPSVAAAYTVVAERERRSLDLLMALPVRVSDILLAKLLATLVVAAVVVLPLFAVDAAILLATGEASLVYVGALLLLLLSALACSVGLALLLALLARDFRTANNLNGALVGPLIVLSMGVLVSVPGIARVLVLAALLLLVAAAAVAVALRWLTFERYLA